MFSQIDGISIIGISSAVPKKIFKNINYTGSGDIKKFIELTGIEERRVSSDDMCTSDLVYVAAEKILDDLNWKKESIKCIIFVSQTADYLTPCSSIILQKRLSLPNNVLAFDINLGCSGFPYSISIISSMMNNLNLERGLIFIGDTCTRLCNVNDKSAWPLFGDAASVIALEKKKKPKEMFFNYYTDGSGYGDIIVNSHSLSGRKKATVDSFKEIDCLSEIKRNDFNMKLNGPNIFSFAISKVPTLIKDLISETKVSVEDIKYCFLHQANKLINQTIEKKLDLKKTIFPKSLKKFGNTSSATIPLTITLEAKKNFFSGLSVISGFGVGLSVSNAIINFENVYISNLLEC
jgi:3-oxoacyl-[acyl-carrier-protein] synthase-3